MTVTEIPTMQATYHELYEAIGRGLYGWKDNAHPPFDEQLQVENLTRSLFEGYANKPTGQPRPNPPVPSGACPCCGR